MNEALRRNKQLVKRLYEECINAGQIELLEELIAMNFVDPRGKKGPAGFAQTVLLIKSGFPDFHFKIEDLIAEGDRVVVRWKMVGTHLGHFAGFPPSGEHVAQTAIVIYQIKDAKIVRGWLQSESLGLIHQIGNAVGSRSNIPSLTTRSSNYRMGLAVKD